MNILQINSADRGGGAENVALDLHSEYRVRGHKAWLAVGQKYGADPNVISIDNESRGTPWAKLWTRAGAIANSAVFNHARGAGRVSEAFGRIAHPHRAFDWWRGIEHFEYPASRDVIELPGDRPVIVQAHNLHSGYFDLSALQPISLQTPTVLTLHDAWLLSGHCAHSFECKKWEHGCGNCPDLSIYPSVRRDATAENWLRKKNIFNQATLYVATPSRWLMDKVDQSILSESIVEKRVIPNGVDLAVFNPTDKIDARRKLGLPVESFVVMFAANGIRKNIWKDYKTLRTAIGLIGRTDRDTNLIFVAVGESAPKEQIGSAALIFEPYQTNPKTVAYYYNAADVYVHAARADTFPSTVIEALACGTPVVATSVGGIPEQVTDGLDGFLAAPGDANAIAEYIIKLILEPETVRRMSDVAVANARQRFDLRRAASDYLDWFGEILDQRQSKDTSTG